MRVAIATRDRENANGHFASTQLLVFYEVNTEGFHFVDEVAFDVVSQEEGQTRSNQDGTLLTAKLKAMEGCVMLFVTAIGAPAAAQVIKINVYPVKLTNPEPIASVMQRVQTMLKGNPPPWLRKVLAAHDPACAPSP